MGMSSDGCLYFGFALFDDGDDEQDDVRVAELFGVELEEGEEFEFEYCISPELKCSDEDYEKETDAESQARWAATREAVKNCPVSLEMYCSYDYPMYVLAVAGCTFTVSRGDTEEITTLDVDPDKIAAAKAWCEEHSIEWQEPKWLLCSMYG